MPALVLAGVPDAHLYTLHGIRVGGAQKLATGRASIDSIMFLGKWKGPDMVIHYADGAGQLAVQAAQQFFPAAARLGGH